MFALVSGIAQGAPPRGVPLPNLLASSPPTTPRVSFGAVPNPARGKASGVIVHGPDGNSPIGARGHLQVRGSLVLVHSGCSCTVCCVGCRVKRVQTAPRPPSIRAGSKAGHHRRCAFKTPVITRRSEHAPSTKSVRFSTSAFGQRRVQPQKTVPSPDRASFEAFYLPWLLRR